MQLCRIGGWERSPLSIGDSGFRDWIQDRYAELVSQQKHREDISFRPSEKRLPPNDILTRLAEIMQCDLNAFSTRAHGQPHRPFAAHFLTRFGGLSRREAGGCLGVGTGSAVSRQLARYEQMVEDDRRLKSLRRVVNQVCLMRRRWGSGEKNCHLSRSDPNFLRYEQMVEDDRRLKRLAASCESSLLDEAKVEGVVGKNCHLSPACCPNR